MCMCMCLYVCRVAEHESENLMGLTNLATIFAAVLVSSDAVSLNLLSHLDFSFIKLQSISRINR